MIKKYRIISVLLIACLLFLFCGCEAGIEETDSAAEEEVTYNLPLLLPVSGEISNLGEDALWAAEYAVDEYGAALLEEEYLPYLQEDEWYDGLYAYVQTSREYLQLAEEGTPVGQDDSGLYLIAIGVSFVVALIVCLILKAGMKNVHIKQEAGAYIAGGLDLTVRSDRFTPKTETRTKIEKQTSTAKSGGGGHGRSAKF